MGPGLPEPGAGKRAFAVVRIKARSADIAALQTAHGNGCSTLVSSHCLNRLDVGLVDFLKPFISNVGKFFHRRRWARLGRNALNSKKMTTDTSCYWRATKPNSIRASAGSTLPTKSASFTRANISSTAVRIRKTRLLSNFSVFSQY